MLSAVEVEEHTYVGMEDRSSDVNEKILQKPKPI
jgi:hypothetical protein